MSTRLDAARAELDRYHALHDWLAREVEAKNWVAYDEIAEQLAKVNEVSTRRPAPVTVEWAAEIRYLDGAVRHDMTLSRSHAEAFAESINLHIASLNEPTRLENGEEGAYAASREIRRFPDGSKLIGPWVRSESASEVV